MWAVWISLLMMFCISSSSALSQSYYQEYENKYQADTSVHSIVELSTDESVLECATFCKMQGSLFR